ncbi:hypothetical protein CGCF413_v005032 [Colletotrichum fructicola]|nr:hypothetical protein CGCF413_v005032 [Colletotrichum fructicola]
MRRVAGLESGIWSLESGVWSLESRVSRPGSGARFSFPSTGALVFGQALALLVAPGTKAKLSQDLFDFEAR